MISQNCVLEPVNAFENISAIIRNIWPDLFRGKQSRVAGLAVPANLTGFRVRRQCQLAMSSISLQFWSDLRLVRTDLGSTRTPIRCPAIVEYESLLYVARVRRPSHNGECEPELPSLADIGRSGTNLSKDSTPARDELIGVATTLHCGCSGSQPVAGSNDLQRPSRTKLATARKFRPS